MLSIQRDHNDYLYEQVIQMIIEARDTGTFRPGDKVPSLRALSHKLKVSIPTVRHAYEELERRGVIAARPKSGYFLTIPDYNLDQPRRVSASKQPTNVQRQDLIDQVFQSMHKPGIIPLGIANPSTAHPCDKALARITRQVLLRAGERAVSYAQIEGHLPLRRQLSLRALDQGLHVDPAEVLITNGAQEALAIALQCVASPGDVIAVESPCYFGGLELIESLGMMALEIPLCPDHGIWMQDLETAISSHKVKACLFSSSISNPLGSLMNEDKKAAIVSMLESKNIPLIEDDVYGDLYFTESRGNLAQNYSKKGLVLSASSFSKTAAPGHRIGWLMAGKYIDKAKKIKRALSCSSSLVNQMVLADFVASGEYDRNMRSLRQVLKRNKARMTALVHACFPENTRVSDPKGAGVLWIELPPGNDSQDLFQSALEHNISIAPGALFAASNRYKRCVRVSFGVPWTDQIEEAVKTLGRICR